MEPTLPQRRRRAHPDTRCAFTRLANLPVPQDACGTMSFCRDERGRLTLASGGGRRDPRGHASVGCDGSLIDHPEPGAVGLSTCHLGRRATVCEGGGGQRDVTIDHCRLLFTQAELGLAGEHCGVLAPDLRMTTD